MTPTPMISVIVPFYNEYAYLENTILSVLFQTYKNLEILIVDDSGVHGAQTVIKNIKKISAFVCWIMVKIVVYPPPEILDWIMPKAIGFTFWTVMILSVQIFLNDA